MGPIGSKVIEVKGQIYVFFFLLFVPFRSLGRSSPNPAPDISSRGSFLKVKVIKVKGQISVSVCSSQVLGPIFTKHGGNDEGGPGY